ncbi:hypothetical protein ASD83_05315 [Devosia sp. Root685]|uniref:hypothetical protein n=1 Tax=Devosia sp. Root685 TaxID=1736587 RepID=UPI0006F621CE|nr:hypothetical protein [Devosia sp. Root685]KRA99905.1 hypothetical protein ASD83_05315 [Devosia sp. Root685]
MSTDQQRLEKFQRILPRLALLEPQPGEGIVIGIDPPMAELCDITLRLVHESGRTYAQRDVQLSPEVTRIPLAATHNLPLGDFEVVITPPLAEYYSMTQIEHRLPLSLGGAPAAQSGAGPAATQSNKIEQHPLEVRPITSGKHHFFGYYDKYPWNQSGRYHLALETDFVDRQPTRDDVAVIGMIDTEDGNRWIPLAETSAWSWQQGTMLQWLPSSPEDTIIYNVREDDRFYAVIHNVVTDEKRRLSRSFYAVAEDYAVGLNYARLHHTRPGYGYPDGAENTLPDPHPDHDGVYRIDLKTGESELIISLQRLFETQTIPRMHLGPHWVNHLTISPDGSNFVFLNRCQFDPKVRFNDRFYRSSPDGKDIRLVHDNTYFSHFGYFDERTIVAYARTPGTDTDEYALYDLYEDKFTPIGQEVFSSDGHCSFSPDRKWMLTDTYPDAESNRILILYEMATGRRVDIGKFFSPPELKNEIRCDLHPRWSRDGRKVSIDSAHTGQRQIHVIDVSAITGARS